MTIADKQALSERDICTKFITPALRAADVVLARLLQLRELATLEARVADLERRAGLEPAE